MAAASLFVWWYLDIEWLDAWMPNIVIGLFAVAVTVTLVEGIVQREERERVRPRVQGVLAQLGPPFRWFTTQVLVDYGMTHAHSNYEIGGDATDILRAWNQDNHTDDLSAVRATTRLALQDGLEFVQLATQLCANDRDALPQDLVVAIDHLGVAAAMGAQDDWMSDHEQLGPVYRRWRLLVVVTAVLGFADTLRRHCDPMWFTISEDMIRNEAVPREPGGAAGAHGST
jgi:hypothetical protein